MSRIDEIAHRVVSLILVPILTVTILSLILSFSLQRGGRLPSFSASLDTNGLIAFILHLGSTILVGEYAGLSGYFTGLVNLSGMLSLVALFLLIILVCMIDRAIYYLGWSFPFDFEFDMDAYARANVDDPRISQFHELVGQSLSFSDAYGVGATYLGMKSTDPYRLQSRSFVLSRISLALDGFNYAKGYSVILVGLMILWPFNAAIHNVFSFSRLAWFLLAACLSLLFWALRYSHMYQELVLQDMDHFVWVSYCRGDDEKSMSHDKNEGVVATNDTAPKGVNRFLHRLFLKFDPAGPYYMWFLLFRRRPL